MGGSARVTSIAAIESFKARLAEFGVDAANALASIDMEIRRVFEWVEAQTKHWQREVRKRQELVSRAKSDLDTRKWMMRDGLGPGTTEQEIALAEAVRSLHRAEDKVDYCRYWSRTLPQEVLECEGPARNLAGFLESELRQALALLDQKIAALDAYVALVAPSGAGTAAPGGPATASGEAPSAAGTTSENA
jgi:hypothetical protein